MAQVTVRRPFDELDLRDQLRPKPDALCHILFRKRMWTFLYLGQIYKGTAVDLESNEPPEHITAKARHEPVLYFLRVIEPAVFAVIADYQCVKRISPESVAANYELLA